MKRPPLSRPIHALTLSLFGGGLLAFSPLVHAKDSPLERQATELAQLRSEVEELHLNLEQMRQETQVEVRALASQKASLSAELQRARLRVEQLKAERAKKRAVIQEASHKQRSLVEPLTSWLKALEVEVQSQLPYRREGRVKELQRLSEQLQSALLLPSQALTRAWSWVEDELKLSRESAMDKMIITLEGEEVLADVIRVGMVLMLCRTAQGQYGVSEPPSASRPAWGWRLLRDESPEREASRLMFERFEQRVTQGFFWVPSSLQFSTQRR